MQSGDSLSPFRFMAKARYHFNHKSLTFEKVNLKLKDRLIKLLSFLATAMVFSTVVIFIAYNFFSSPREKSLEREIAQYKLQ